MVPMVRGPTLTLYPARDIRFTRVVQQSMAGIDGRPVDDPGVLAAMEALLVTTYPLATVQRRSAAAGNSWDVFRDAQALDVELLRRARRGESAAAGQLYDRHGRLTYSLALLVAGRPDAAAEAVVEAFQTVIATWPRAGTVRLCLARAAREAGERRASKNVRIAPAPARAAMQRGVIELATVHRLMGEEIASVLGLELRHVGALVKEGLEALALSHSGGDESARHKS
jgi:hypothetical protein